MWPGGGPASQLSLVLGRSWFPTGCWTNSFSRLSSSKKASEKSQREVPASHKSLSFIILILKVTSYHFCYILFTRCKLLVPGHTQGRGWGLHQGVTNQDPQDHLTRLPISRSPGNWALHSCVPHSQAQAPFAYDRSVELGCRGSVASVTTTEYIHPGQPHPLIPAGRIPGNSFHKGKEREWGESVRSMTSVLPPSCYVWCPSP